MIAMIVGALPVGAAPDHQRQPTQPSQGDDGAMAVIGDPQALPTSPAHKPCPQALPTSPAHTPGTQSSEELT
jgi:hypothetical protein